MSTATPTPVSAWEPRTIFFEENWVIYSIHYDGTGKQPLVADERLLSASPDGTQLITAAEGQALLRTYEGEQHPISRGNHYYWAPDAQSVVILLTHVREDEANEYEYWDTVSMQVKRFQLDGELVGLELLQGGRFVLESISASDYDVDYDLEQGYYEYDIQTGELTMVHKLLDDQVRPIAVGGRREGVPSPEGKQLAISLDGINLWILDLETRKMEQKTHLSVDPYPGGVGRIVWSPDARQLAVSQIEIYHRQERTFEYRILFLDLVTERSTTVSSNILPGLLELPDDVYDYFLLFEPQGWNQDGGRVFVYFEGETQEAALGHVDEKNYRHMHRYWLLDLETLEWQELPWLENTHAIFSTH
jgi:hypothetical protein